MKKIVLLVTGGAVSGALIETSKKKGELPHVLRVAREGSAMGTAYDPARFIADLPTRMSAVAATLGATEAVPIAVCLSAPFTLSQVQVVKQKTPEPHPVSKGEIDQMLAKASQTFVQAHGSLLATLSPGEPVALESLLLGSLLNGYHVLDPVGLSASEREFHLYATLTSITLRDALTSAITTAWPRHSELTFSSFPYAAARAFVTLFPDYDSVALISVGEDYSEVVMVWDDVIADVSIVTLGTNNYINRIATALSVDAAHALSAVRLYAEGGATPEASERIIEASRVIKDEWIKAFSLAAHSALEEFFLPARIALLSAEPAVSSALSRALSADLSFLSFSDASFNFLSLEAELAKVLILPEKDTQNPALLLVSLFYAKIG